MKKLFANFLIVLYAIVFITSAKTAYGYTVPSFPSCLNPQGTTIAQYNDGTHGIAGSTAAFTGKDTVYQVSNNVVVQCMCPDNGQAIQTNWLNTSGLTDEDIKSLESLGWTFISSGTVWGLSDTSYLAQNINYSCQSNNTTPTPTPNTPVTQTVNAVIGLADTGEIITLYAVFGLGIVSILSGIILRKKTTGK